MSVKQRIDCMAYFCQFYKNAVSKKDKASIIDEVCSLFHYHRKAAIRHLNKAIEFNV